MAAFTSQSVLQFLSLFVLYLCVFPSFYLFGKANAITIKGIQHKAQHLSLKAIQQREIIEDLFTDYIALFNKSYSHPKSYVLESNELPTEQISNAIKDYEHRLKVFQQSLIRHASLNEYERINNGTAIFGINKFSDLTPGEFQGLLNPSRPVAEFFENKNEKKNFEEKQSNFCFHDRTIPYPESIDWRKGHVTAVKDQMKCGSCWAFTATQQVESYWSIKNHPLEEFSVQELISCSTKTGCLGGNTCYVLEWLSVAQFPKGGSKLRLVPASYYPYEDRESVCLYDELKREGATISAVCGCTIHVGQEKVMAQWMHQKGPIGVSVNAISWHDYIGGVIQHHCSANVLNHAVQLVGYNMSGPVPYWIAKNSWGPDYGEDGYLRIKFGGNLCGVALEPSYIVI